MVKRTRAKNLEHFPAPTAEPPQTAHATHHAAHPGQSPAKHGHTTPAETYHGSGIILGAGVLPAAELPAAELDATAPTAELYTSRLDTTAPAAELNLPSPYAQRFHSRGIADGHHCPICERPTTPVAPDHTHCAHHGHFTLRPQA